METGVPVLLNNEGAIKGNAVINIISKSKVENIRTSLLKYLSFDQDETGDVPE
jgi:hypothetical protein